jgi:CDP-glycerol glycerophosphotransferase
VPLSGIDVAAVRATLAERFGGTWEILIRTSDPSRARSDIALSGLPAYCRNASFHPDAQELLVVADAVLADRSDRLGDYLLTRRPAFLFDTDPERRDAADFPLPAATSSGELLAAIAQFDQEVHDQRVAQLLARSGSADDGAAARRIVDAIGDLMAR